MINPFINTDAAPDELPAEDFSIPGRDLLIVAQFLAPTDAHLARGFLVASGIPAVVADANHAQAYELIAPAMGGVRVLAPEEYIEEARRLLASREQGDFALDDDQDVGPSQE
ncbi:DUF2007 domain-containing protein [Massilia sp. PAMC28688]|uniref:putative signal transducing protein n=1 Tax=Massilia sp. PAMC28688 TaxID=2861283 RepID=UPI001C62D798|nr:DUF2007 domain-containing protein [Massilia sp. PAMC28688]QYF91663.1 DUF2007 domain-containing protein [Massilia sp. PAMC28688]